jgi:hypothetical protein
MNSLRIEKQELARMRDNVCRKINALELCWYCDRICECEQSFINESFPVWLCGKCSPEVSYRLEKLTGVPVAILPLTTQDFDRRVRTAVEIESSKRQMRTSRCLCCNSMIEKKRLSDKWICGQCGWEQSA